jgi:hypothetical protein
VHEGRQADRAAEDRAGEVEGPDDLLSRRSTRITRRDATGRPIAWEGDDPPGVHDARPRNRRPRVHPPPRDLDKLLEALRIRVRR